MKSIYKEEYRRLIKTLSLARREAGMTQHQLAEALKKPQSYVSKIENGERRMDVIEFMEICAVLGVDPKGFF